MNAFSFQVVYIYQEEIVQVYKDEEIDSKISSTTSSGFSASAIALPRSVTLNPFQGLIL